MWRFLGGNMQKLQQREKPGEEKLHFLQKFETNSILIYLVDLTGIYEMMYRSMCI